MRILRVLTRSVLARQSVRTAVNPVVERILEHADACRGDPFLNMMTRDGSLAALSYAALVEQADAWRRRYRDAGIRAGDRVVVILGHGQDLYAAYLGALLGAHRPAYYAHPSPKIDETSYCESVRKLLAATGADVIVSSRAMLAPLCERIGAPHVLFDDGTTMAGNGARGTSAPRADEESLFMQFSSGTTGLKKGVSITADALLRQVDAYAATIGLRSDDRIASWLPLYHDMGLIACFFLPLLKAVPFVSMSPFDWVTRPGMLLDAVTRTRATLAWLPNFAYNFLATRAEAGVAAWDLSTLRAVVNCSEPILAESHDAFVKRFACHGLRADALATCYAMAENTFAVTASAPGAPAVVETVDGRSLVPGGAVRIAEAGSAGARRVVSSGRALPDTDVRICGANGESLPAGHIGEIAIRSPSLFVGYVGNPAETAVALRDDCFHTGDLGYARNGELFVIGRIKDTIIVGGRNIFPQDVEAVVNGVDGVIPGRSVAVGVDDARLGTQNLVVLAETQVSDPSARAALRKRIREAVAHGLDVVPGDVSLCDHMWLRKSTSGKLSRRENRERYLEARAAAGDASSRGTPTPSGVSSEVRACVVEAAYEAGARDAPPFTDDEDLVREGVLDSFSIVGLHLALERRFGRDRVRPVLDRPQCYGSVNAIAAALSPAPVPRAVAPSAAAAPAGALRQERKYLLAPQMRDVEAQPYQWFAYLMRRGMPEFRSPTLNSDEYGFRLTYRSGAPVRFAAFAERGEGRAVVLGNSFAYGIGTSHDARTLASRLNDDPRVSGYLWYNFALRASVTMQERLALDLFADPDPDVVIWVSGINNLIGLIAGEGVPGNPAPFVGERQFAARMSSSAPPAHPDRLEQRYPRMLRQLERDLASVASRLRGRGRFLFCLQPSASWVGKAWTAEEAELIALFDGAGAALQNAHHPRHLGPLHRPYADDLAAICARCGAEFIDANADPRLRNPEWLFIDRTHMTDTGHALVADIVAARLAAPSAA